MRRLSVCSFGLSYLRKGGVTGVVALNRRRTLLVALLMSNMAVMSPNQLTSVFIGQGGLTRCNYTI